MMVRFNLFLLDHHGHLTEEPTATSNAPSIGRKRRMNDEDADEQETGSSRKRRGQVERQDTSSSELGELGVKEAKASEVDPDVKQVTRGVKEVELDDKKEESRTDDGEGGVSEQAPKVLDGESSVAAPLDPKQHDDDPSQDATATDDKAEVPADQSEATTAEAPSNDPPEVDAPTSKDCKVSSSQDDEKEILDTTPGTGSDEVGDTRVSVESSPEP
jgi:hypothetical protein